MSEAINISANETSVNDILTRDHRFEVPNYQRQYSWTEKQWTDLWDDLNSIGPEGTHFLGSVVVISGDYEPTGPNHLQLVDGQQRLATLSILLCALRQRYEELGNQNDVETLNDKYLWRTGFEEPRPRISLGDLDDSDYLRILNGKTDQTMQNPLLVDAYDYFYEKLSDADETTLDTIRDTLLQRMSIVLITSGSEASAFRLFETLNDRGLDLSAIDLMKNHLLRVASEESQVNANEIKEEWEQIITNLRELSERIRFFRHYIMSSPAPVTRDRVTSSGVYDRFKQLIAEILDSNELSLEGYIEDMERQSRLYVQIARARIEHFHRLKNVELNQGLENLNEIGATPARTLLLRAFYELDDPNRLVRIVELAEQFMLRRNIARYSTGSGLDEMYSRLAHDAFSGPNPVKEIRTTLRENAPSDDEFITNFAERNHRQNSQTKYILDTLEQSRFSNSGKGKEVRDRTQVHIEHIAPQRTFTAKKYSSWIPYLGIDEPTFLQHRNRIGNLTLLERNRNEAASDEPFEQKKHWYRDSDFEMTRMLCGYNKWSIELIDERSKELASIAAEIWNLE